MLGRMVGDLRALLENSEGPGWSELKTLDRRSWFGTQTKSGLKLWPGAYLYGTESKEPAETIRDALASIGYVAKVSGVNDRVLFAISEPLNYMVCRDLSCVPLNKQAIGQYIIDLAGFGRPPACL